MLIAIALMVLISSLPVSDILALEFDPIELMDMEEESENKKDNEETKEKEKFHSVSTLDGASLASRSNQIYFKEHLITEVTTAVSTPPPERS